MSTRKEKEKRHAIQLRLEGKSYNEIRRTLNLSSKVTISRWLKDLQLTPRAKKRLQENMKRAQVRGFSKFNEERTSRVRKENGTALIDGEKTVGTLSDRELLLVGAALYWGEGTKTVTKSGARISFANSDPLMVRLFMQFVRKILKVPEMKIRAGIHLYENISTAGGKKYWAKVTGLPPERFYVIRQVSKASKRIRGQRFLPYGTAVIRVNDRKMFYRTCGMIKGLSQQKQ